MSATQDFVALDWIKKEISQILEQAQHALEKAVEAEDGTSDMRVCLSAIHQVHGTLKMVQLDGPLSIAQEMEELAEALMNNDVEDLEQAQEILMQSILQMPGYLDRIQREQKDNPEFVHPAVNNLRVARGLEGLHEDASGEDVDQFILLSAAPSAEVLEQFRALGGNDTVKKIKQLYQKSLLSILKNNKVKENLVQIGKLFSKLSKTCGESPLGNLSQLGLALIEGVVTSGIKLDSKLVRQLKQIDSVLKAVASGDVKALEVPMPNGLGEDIYSSLKGSVKESPKILLALAKFDAKAPLRDIKVEHVDFGPDDDTLSAVSRILIEEIVTITDKLDLYVRSTNREVSNLFSLMPLMSQVSSTMSVVGLTNHQDNIARQMELIGQIQSSGEDPNDDQLLEIASSLLEIQSALGKIVGSMDGENSLESIGDLDEAQAAVIRETRNSLALCKDAVINYVTSDFDVEKVEKLPEILKNLRGGLSIANQQRSADVLEACASYVTEVLLRDTVKPSLADMDDFADAVTSIDYYLERYLESASDPYLQMVEVAEDAIEKLGFSVKNLGQGSSLNKTVMEQVTEGLNDTIVQSPSAEIALPIENESPFEIEELLAEEIEEPLAKEIEEPSAEIIEEPSAEIIEEPSAEIIEEPSAEIIEEPSAEIIEEFTDEVIEELSVDEESVSGSEEDDLIDDEIIEIFIEEAEEVLEVISEYLPQWQDDHGDEDARTELRRAFHTLKGSGRMVGATVVAELAWSIENLLNRVIDNTISLSNDILSLIAEVVTQLPQGIEAFKENHQETFVVDHLVQRAEACLTDDDMSTELGSQVLAVIEEPSAEETEEPSAEEIAEPSAEEIAEPSAEEIAEPSAEEIEEFLAEEIEEPSAEIEDSASNIEAFLAEESFDELEEPLLELAESEDAADSLADLEEMLSEDDEFDEDFELGEIEPPSKGLESQHEESPEIDAFFAEMEEPSAEIEEPSAEIEEPSAEIEEPSAEIEEPSAEIEEPSAEIEEPSAVTEDASVELVDSEDIDILESIEELESIEVVGEIDENLLEIDESASDFSLNGLSTVEEIFVPETEIQLVGDAELDGIFIEEANESISIIREYSNAGGLIPSDVVAAYHTLKGSAGMAEVPVVASIAGPMEKLSNQNYVAGIEADDAFLDLVKRSIELMASVTQNLSTKRTSLDELNDFLSQVSLFEASLDDIELPPLFEFDKIVVLSMSSDINWTDLPLEKIIGELKLVQNQSIATKQGYLNRLCEGMLSVYSQIKSKPPVAVIDLLKIAHENLVIVFDHIASSQDVVSFESLVDDLNDVDVEELGLKEELYQYANDSIEALENVGSLFEDWFEDWFEDFNNLLALQQVTIALSELETSADSYGQKDIANLAEPILQLCEKFALGNLVANEEDKALVSSGISALKRQFQALQNSEELLIDESVLGAFRNRLETTAISSPETDDSGEELLLPEDDVEKDILPIFLEEAEELCESIDESILAWSGDTGSNSHLNNLLRHLHTIKGGARLAGLNSLGEYTHNFETFLIGIQQNPTTLNDQFFSLLNSHQDEITRRIEIYNKVAIGGASELELQSLRLVTAPSSADNKLDEEHSFESLSSESSASENADAENQTAESGDIIDLPEDDIDEEILSIFIEEADELIEALDQSILDWSNSPEKSEHFDNLLRHLHTMKGGSRLAGLNSLGEYTHNFETYLTGIKQSADKVSLDDNFFSGLNKHQDEITRRVEVYKKLVQGEASEEDLNSLAQSQDLSVSNQASIKGSDASLDKKVSVETKSEEHEQAAASQPQEMVRVSADLLEDLISLSGEANITRGRIEQQITDFGDSLEEMESTIDRIRDQVRRLEIEAESRETVLRNTGGAEESDSNFDELEMDRYTMLQEISRTLNESSSDMAGLKDTLVNKSKDTETLLHQHARIGSELQEGLTRTRMVPISRLIPRLRRIVRQISAEVGKSVRFDAFNVEGELDRNVLERIIAPLEHMLRNAVDHGIESAEKRSTANKPETGRISMRLSREGGYVLLTISDDGGGINVQAVRKKAVERGIISEDAEVSDVEVMQFIMHAGFSTAAALTQISGRGVGMDVVNSEIKQLGGTVTIDSTLHVGTEFTIRIPFTVSINRALMVLVKDETFAVPLNTIEGIVRVSPYELEAYYQPDAPMFEYAGQPYTLNYMGEMLDKSGGPILEGQVALLPVILARSGDESVALQVDRVIGSREVVVKTLGPQFNEVGGISGATVLGDGSVVIILDVMALVRNHESRQKERQKELDGGSSLDIIEEIVDPVKRARKIMIVDDSVTVRKVTTRLMERQGWDVTTAKDGVDAINKLQDYYPDIVLLDIEMPKMDGFGVLRAVRRDPRLSELPIIMITSRTGEKHKQQAFELGVNQYLGKPFQETNLIATIETVIAEAKQ